MSWLTVLNHDVIACTRCPRLVEYREKIAREKRRAYLSWDYWGKPVPGFGDPKARVLIMGLAPKNGHRRDEPHFSSPDLGNAEPKILFPSESTFHSLASLPP